MFYYVCTIHFTIHALYLISPFFFALMILHIVHGRVAPPLHFITPTTWYYLHYLFTILHTFLNPVSTKLMYYHVSHFNIYTFYLCTFWCFHLHCSFIFSHSNCYNSHSFSSKVQFFSFFVLLHSISVFTHAFLFSQCYHSFLYLSIYYFQSYYFIIFLAGFVPRFLHLNCSYSSVV